MRYIDTEPLLKEINRIEEEARKVRVSGTDKEAIGADGKVKLCLKLKFLIDSLQQEQQEEPDKSLEEAADTYAEKHGFRVPYDGSDNYYDEVDVKASKEGFIAGAKWAEKQIPISKDLYKASVEYSREPDEDGMEVFNAEKGVAFADGAEWQKEQMLKDAMEVTVKEDAGGYPYIDMDIPLAKRGDKVRIIIMKEEE